MHVVDPALALGLDLDARDDALLDPLAAPQVEGPLLVAPLPAAGGRDVLEEAGAARALVGDARAAQRVVRAGREEPGLPLAGGGAELLQLEDLDLARLRRRVEDDVARDPGVEQRGGGGLAGRDVRVVRGGEELGDGGVAGDDGEPAAEEEGEAPGEEVGGDEEGGGGHEEEEEEGGGEGLVAEVGRGRERRDDVVVDLAEVLHAVLQVAHVAEEVLGQLLDGLDRRGGRDGGPARGVLEGGCEGDGRGRVARHEGGDEDAEEEAGEGEHGEQVRVEADEGVDGEEGDGVGRRAPAQEADHARLEDEDDADAGVEAPEVGGHGWETEAGALDVVVMGGRAVFRWLVLDGYDLL